MNIKNILSEKIAGEITLSSKPGQTIRKWRNVFSISQTELAGFLNLSPSVISDYESGRRKSPGIKTIKKVIKAFVEIDEKKGGVVLRQYQPMAENHDGIIEIMEYPYTVPVDDFIKKIDGNILTQSKIGMNKNVKGFTLIDSIKTIKSINSIDYSRFYGWSADRALIFTDISYGRSPMIAVRVHPIKPTVVVYHQPESIDPLAIKLAEHEDISLVETKISLNNLKQKLISIGEK